MRNDSAVFTAARSPSSASTRKVRSLSVSFIRSIVSVCSLVIIGCALGGLQPSPRVTDANAKIVAIVWPSEITAPLDPIAWRASPWHRSDDVVTPSRVVISTDRYACIMRDGDTRDPRPAQVFKCADSWRYPRSRGR